MTFLENNRRLARALLVVVSTSVAVLFVDTTCRIGRASWRRLEEFRVARPLPYEHADYFSQEFLDDQSRVRLVRATSGAYLLHEDTAGRYINIVGGLRWTTDHPSLPTRRVLVFGGSTILSAEVPDQHTIPSYLQRMINTSCETQVAVLNYGVNSMTAGQNRARLMDVGVQPHDIVVFYGGGNDAYYSLHDDERVLDVEIDESRDSPTILGWITAASAIPPVVAALQRLAAPETVPDPVTLRRSLDHLEADYRYQLVETHRFVTQHRGEFVHFLQPQLFATAVATAYRREIAGDDDLAFQLGYPRLRQAMSDAAQHGVESFDLSGLLAVDRVPSEVFLDFAHVNHVANDIIARAIFARITRLIGDCDA